MSGRTVVLAMIVFGILATAILWTYWTIHMTPFMPLQEALEKEFPDSRPHVMGGSVKKNGDSVLRVVLQADFDPRADTASNTSKVLSRLERVRVLATELANLSSYRVLAMHLYFPLKEQGISQRTYFRDVATWEELDAATLIGTERDPTRDQRPVTKSEDL